MDSQAGIGLIGRQWQILRQDAERWGGIGALYRLLMSGVKKAFGLRIAFAITRPMHADLSDNATAAGYEIRRLEEATYDSVFANPELDVTPEFTANISQAGGFCMGAFYEGDLVAYVWRAFEDAPAEDGFRLRVQKPLRCGFKALTLPEHRGKHLQSPISLASDKMCIDMGYSVSMSFIASHNFASLKSDRRRGGKRVGWFVTVSKGPVRWYYSSPGAKAAGVELYDPV